MRKLCRYARWSSTRTRSTEKDRSRRSELLVPATSGVQDFQVSRASWRGDREIGSIPDSDPAARRWRRRPASPAAGSGPPPARHASITPASSPPRGGRPRSRRPSTRTAPAGDSTVSSASQDTKRVVITSSTVQSSGARARATTLTTMSRSLITPARLPSRRQMGSKRAPEPLHAPGGVLDRLPAGQRRRLFAVREPSWASSSAMRMDSPRA